MRWTSVAPRDCVFNQQTNARWTLCASPNEKEKVHAESFPKKLGTCTERFCGGYSVADKIECRFEMNLEAVASLFNAHAMRTSNSRRFNFLHFILLLRVFLFFFFFHDMAWLRRLCVVGMNSVLVHLQFIQCDLLQDDFWCWKFIK